MNSKLEKILDKLDGTNPKALNELRGFIDITIGKKTFVECGGSTDPTKYKKKLMLTSITFQEFVKDVSHFTLEVKING